MRDSEYFDYLAVLVWDYDPDILAVEEDERLENRLLHQLYKMEFEALVPNDDNRCYDGLELREQFIDGGGGQHALPPGSCTVLEMLIGLSFRLEFETTQSKWEKTFTQWFWILIDNLDLGYHTNQDLTRAEYHDKIVEKVTNLVERHYSFDGSGGLFPLNHPKEDQREVEIWYQMSAYILENYPI